MKAEEMRQFTASELNAKLLQWQDELFKNRINLFTSEMKDTSVFKKLKKNIARAKTILTEKHKASPTGAASDQPVGDKEVSK